MTVVAWLVLGAPVSAGDSGPAGRDRLVHEFDFDERDEGNLESVPKYWIRFATVGFPRFAEAGFDFEVGHDAPPSFRLQSDGRNVAFRYLGNALPVRPGSEYVVSGYVRGEGLVHARATVSAYYLDRNDLPIRSTQVFAELMGAAVDNDDWQPFSVAPPAAPNEAVSVGITVWVVQAGTWDNLPKPERHIERNDVRAGAWFDDIRVHRLPAVEITSDAAGNVATHGSQARLRVSVADAAGGVSALLRVTDFGGAVVIDRKLPVGTGEAAALTEIPIGDLPPGPYRAEVDVRDEHESLAKRRLTFCVLRAVESDRDETAGTFGVVLKPEERTDPLTELSLLRMLGVGAVKIPIWSGSANVPDLPDGPAQTERLLYELLQSRVGIIGVLAGPPSSVMKEAGAYPRPLVEYLSEPSSVWHSELARVVARFTSICKSWQIGRDNDVEVVADARLDDVLRDVRREMESLTTAPHLTAPGSILWAPNGAPSSADDLCLTVDPAVLPAYADSAFQDYAAQKRGASSAFVPTWPNGADRSGLRDWCKRLAHLRQAGVGTIYVDQPWSTRTTPRGIVAEPTVTLPLLHTFVHLLGRATPGGRVYIAPSVTAFAFHEGDQSVLIMWDREAGNESRTYDVLLGDSVRQVDMWGRSVALDRLDDGRSRLSLSGDPVFVEGVDRWLIEFRTGIQLSPNHIEFAIDSHRHVLRLVNPHRQSLSGSVRLTPPEGWDLLPRRFEFDLPPGDSTEQSLEIRYHRSATAGEKVIDLHVQLTADKEYTLDVPIEVNLGSSDLDAWGQAILRGNRLIVRHQVMNRSDQVLSLRSTAAAPGRPRQSRPITALAPGRSALLEYQFGDAASLIGEPVRLLLRELEGSRMHNVEVYVR